MYTLIIYIKQNSTVLSFLQFSINRLHKIIWMKRYSWDNCLTTGCTNFLWLGTTGFFPNFYDNFAGCIAVQLAQPPDNWLAIN